jgi:sulfatase modifying factor 1
MKTTTATAGLLIAASVFSSLARASVTMDWVTVGNAGNAANPLTGYGSVAHEYKIGKYEVTNEQYGAFLNAAAKTDSYGLYNSNMSTYGITRSGSNGNYTYSVTGALANRPVVYVSWLDAARFANWLANGQGSGDTETGSYTLNGATSSVIHANVGAQVYLPNDQEWYKAAYYNANNQNYSIYPIGQNSISTSDANYANSIGYATDVGFYSHASSFYGTYDQGGNVWELSGLFYDIWNKKFIPRLQGGSWGWGTYGNSMYKDLSSIDSNILTDNYFTEDSQRGFRLAAVPEPSAPILTMLASCMMLIRRKR